ncbi:MAG: RDD family protein [Deinococcales bacterium]
MSDWITTIKQSVGGHTHAEINAADAGMLLTDTELIYISISGMQRARLIEIAKVARENGELVISSTERPLIRGTIQTDKETLSNFFSQVRQVAAWARERRTVILDSPSAIPMDSSFIGRTPDVPVQRPELPDPVAQIPVTPPSRPMVTVSQSLSGELQSPTAPPLPRSDFGRGAPPPPPALRSPEEMTAQDRPRISTSPAKMSERRNEAIRLEYAGFWMRFLAYLIDAILLGIGSSILSNLFIGSSLEALVRLATLGNSADSYLVLQQLGTTLSGFVTATILASVAVVILTWLYYAFLESGERQGTLGKMALGLIVTTENNQRLGFWQASFRYFAKSLIPFGITVLTLSSLFPAIGALTAALSQGADAENAAASLLGTFGAIGGISFLGGLLILAAYVMAAFTAKKQALHDILAKTLVLKK